MKSGASEHLCRCPLKLMKKKQATKERKNTHNTANRSTADHRGENSQPRAVPCLLFLPSPKPQPVNPLVNRTPPKRDVTVLTHRWSFLRLVEQVLGAEDHCSATQRLQILATFTWRRPTPVEGSRVAGRYWFGRSPAVSQLNHGCSRINLLIQGHGTHMKTLYESY